MGLISAHEGNLNMQYNQCRIVNTMNAVTTKWKHLREPKARPPSGRPHKFAEWNPQGRSMQKSAFLNCCNSALPNSKLLLEASLGIELFIVSSSEWISMVEHRSSFSSILLSTIINGFGMKQAPMHAMFCRPHTFDHMNSKHSKMSLALNYNCSRIL